MEIEINDDNRELRGYVQCEGCHFVLADHPLSTIDSDAADEIMNAEMKKPRAKKHPNANVVPFDEAQRRITRDVREIAEELK